MMKKIGALVLAVVMIMMVGLAFAATDTYTGSNKADNTGDITGGLIGANTIPLTKGIVMFNTDGSKIREPNISFTYTVKPVNVTEGDITVKDDGSRNIVDGEKTPVTVSVYDGVAAAFTSSLTLDFKETNEKAAAAQTGTELEKTGNLSVDVSAFKHAGIYRYLITETSNPEDVTTVGLDERDSSYNNTRYLDVYVKNGTNGLEMYGAVIYQTTTAQGGDVDTNTTKTTGFEPSSTNYENDKTVDKYHTFNLEVNKTITGGLADLTHDFPFEITLTGDKAATIVADYDNGDATYDGTTIPATINVSTTAVTLKPKMSNADAVTITGIPVGTFVTVKETNDTYDTYTASLTTKTGLDDADMDDTTLTKDASASLKKAVEITDKTQKSVIGLTNNLAEVSPTGVVLRVAPYVLMLAAGVVLLVLARRRKNAKEEA